MFPTPHEHCSTNQCSKSQPSRNAFHPVCESDSNSLCVKPWENRSTFWPTWQTPLSPNDFRRIVDTTQHQTLWPTWQKPLSRNDFRRLAGTTQHHKHHTFLPKRKKECTSGRQPNANGNCIWRPQPINPSDNTHSNQFLNLF